VRHDPSKSEITPDIHHSDILTVIKAARRPQVIDVDDDADVWMLLS
jgi:hypothetical protein